MDSRFKYPKLPGAADGDGLKFECKTIALFYLRLLNANKRFRIASNVDKLFGKFDDIVVVHQNPGEVIWNADLLQLKYKKNKTMSRDNLLGWTKDKDFSLVDLCPSVLGKDCEENNTVFTELVTDLQYVVFTNAKCGLNSLEKADGGYLNTGKGGQVRRLDANLSRNVNLIVDLKRTSDEHLFKSLGLTMKKITSRFAKESFSSTNGMHTYLLDRLSSLHDKITHYKALGESVTIEDVKGFCSKTEWLCFDQLELKEEHSQKVFDKMKDLVVWMDKVNGISGGNEGMNNGEAIVDAGVEKVLPKVRLFTNQASLTELDRLIREELKARCTCEDSVYLDNLNHAFQRWIERWWREEKPHCLTEKSDIFNKVLMEVVSQPKINELQSYRIKFKNDSLKSLLRAIPARGGALQVNVKSLTTVHTILVMRTLQNLVSLLPNDAERQVASHTDELCDQLQQLEVTAEPELPDLAVLRSRFSGESRFLLVDWSTFLRHEKELAWTWKNTSCHTLAVECDTDSAEAEAKINELKADIDRASENEVKKLLVLIRRRTAGNIDADKRYEDDFVGTHLEEYYAFYDIEINLQGKYLKYSKIFKKVMPMEGNEYRFETDFLDQMDSTVLSQILQKEVCCGKFIYQPSGNFEPRWLKKQDGVSVESFDLLKDDAAKVVLVVADAGMGKSTLITHLAKSAKAEDGDGRWIVHIKQHEWTLHLDDLNLEDISVKTAIDFLRLCATTPGNALENNLFDFLKEKMFVFVDGVDSAATPCWRKVARLLGCLKETGVARLWVTCTPDSQLLLTRELKVEAFTMESLRSARLTDAELCDRYDGKCGDARSDRFKIKEFWKRVLSGVHEVYYEHGERGVSEMQPVLARFEGSATNHLICEIKIRRFGNGNDWQVG